MAINTRTIAKCPQLLGGICFHVKGFPTLDEVIEDDLNFFITVKGMMRRFLRRRQ